MDKAIQLTDSQSKAFNKLDGAFKKCSQLGIEIHGELDTLYAINKKGLGLRTVIVGGKNRIISDEAESICPKAFKGCAADDGLGIN